METIHGFEIPKRELTEEDMTVEPECPEDKESSEIDCEFEIRGCSWWCITHNCYA